MYCSNWDPGLDALITGRSAALGAAPDTDVSIALELRSPETSTS
jgi:hypothetical protein